MISPTARRLRIIKAAMPDYTPAITLPAGEFFRPRLGGEFWHHLRLLMQTSDADIVECGCGSGFLLDRAAEMGIRMTGIDICPREGQSRRVRIEDATQRGWAPRTWPLICRPDHSGWFNIVAENALNAGASVVYVGLSRNYHKDVAEFRPKKIAANVGQEGENIYLITPRRTK